MDDHLRRREVECAAALVDTVVWSVVDGAQVDQGQVLATVGRMEHGNLMHLTAPCRGTVRLAVQPAAVDDAVSADGSSKTTVVVAAVEYCIHPLLNGRTCMMCLAIVDENEDDMDGELKSVNVVSHGQVLRLNVDAASTCTGRLLASPALVSDCVASDWQRNSTQTTSGASSAPRSCRWCWIWITLCCTLCA